MIKHIAEEIQDFPVTSRDLAWLFIGKLISTGSERTVYEHAQDPTLVVKYQSGEGFQNIFEWEVWQCVKGTKAAKWFAPVVDISPNGHFLIMKKAESLPNGYFPKKIPAMIGDQKYKNFGMIGKQFVCIDYGTAHILALNKSLKVKKLEMKKAEWWDPQRID